MNVKKVKEEVILDFFGVKITAFGVVVGKI
jgi:hypothetical protein